MTLDPLPQHGLRLGSRARKALLLLQREARWRARRRQHFEPPRNPSDWGPLFRSNLVEGILPFWIEHGVDENHGGMYGWLDREGRPIAPGTKSIVPHARTLWLFSATYRRFPDTRYRGVADHCLEFIMSRFRDRRHGGFYWLLDEQGRLMDDRKHLYGQSLVLSALIEYARAFDHLDSMQEAMELFELLDDCCHDDRNGGYVEIVSGDWATRLDGDRFFGPPADRNQCAQLRLLESLGPLFEMAGEERVKERLEEMINLLVRKMIDVEKGYCYPRTDERWRPLPPYVASYGHDIELVWLLPPAAASIGLGGETLERAAHAMAEHVLAYGFDRGSGGLYWEGPPGEAAVNRVKVRWPQAEALVGFLQAFEFTGEQRFLEAFDLQARYVWSRMIDHDLGEWFDADGILRRTLAAKASIWSDPFHQGRACLEVSRRLSMWAAADSGPDLRSAEKGGCRESIPDPPSTTGDRVYRDQIGE